MHINQHVYLVIPCLSNFRADNYKTSHSRQKMIQPESDTTFKWTHKIIKGAAD